MANAIIVNADGAVGGYLARLLHARGATILATIDGGTGTLAALGSRDDVNIVPASDAIALAATLPDTTIFAVDAPGQEALIAEVIAVAAATTRLVHVADAAATRQRPALDANRAAVAARRDEARRFALNALLGAHDSRLGPVDNVAARVTTHAARIASGDPSVLDLVETGPVDWGWTPEYVDAVARLATLPRPLDMIVGSGVTLTTAVFVDEASAFFKRDLAAGFRLHPGDAEPAMPVDPRGVKAATGWSAHTTGRDLVRALCEGAASRV